MRDDACFAEVEINVEMGVPMNPSINTLRLNDVIEIADKRR